VAEACAGSAAMQRAGTRPLSAAASTASIVDAVTRIMSHHKLKHLLARITAM
jgi:hypothetical protein